MAKKVLRRSSDAMIKRKWNAYEALFLTAAEYLTVCKYSYTEPQVEFLSVYLREMINENDNQTALITLGK